MSIISTVIGYYTSSPNKLERFWLELLAMQLAALQRGQIGSSFAIQD